MVTALAPAQFHRRAQRGLLMTELVIALAILTIAVLPLGYSYVREGRALRSTYQRAVAVEIVDGELELLVAGAGRAFPQGTTEYPVTAGAAVNLPPGKFELTRTGSHLRLEWQAAKRQGSGPVVREGTLK